jgi:hypothetical protein
MSAAITRWLRLKSSDDYLGGLLLYSLEKKEKEK